MEMSTAIFLAAGAVGLFAYLSVTSWAKSRAGERRTQERYALLRQLADRPEASAHLVLELLREEDARLDAAARRKTEKARQDNLMGGWILVAIGIGMAIMMGSIDADHHNLWTIGLLPMSIGVAMLGFELRSGRRHDRDTAAKS